MNYPHSKLVVRLIPGDHSGEADVLSSFGIGKGDERSNEGDVQVQHVDDMFEVCDVLDEHFWRMLPEGHVGMRAMSHRRAQWNLSVNKNNLKKNSRVAKYVR